MKPTVLRWLATQPWCRHAALDIPAAGAQIDAVGLSDPFGTPVNNQHRGQWADAVDAHARRSRNERQRAVSAGRPFVPPTYPGELQLPVRRSEHAPAILAVAVATSMDDIRGVRERTPGYDEVATRCVLAMSPDCLRGRGIEVDQVDDRHAVATRILTVKADSAGVPAHWGLALYVAWYGRPTLEMLRPPTPHREVRNGELLLWLDRIAGTLGRRAMGRAP